MREYPSSAELCMAWTYLAGALLIRHKSTKMYTYEHTGSVDNSIRGVICGARTPSYINILESITIATTGDSTDFGDIPRNGIGYIAGTSDSHGGLVE